MKSSGDPHSECLLTALTLKTVKSIFIMRVHHWTVKRILLQKSDMKVNVNKKISVFTCRPLAGWTMHDS